jgi:signal transduction histidine kinase
VQLWRALDSLADEVPESDRGSVTAARIAAEDVADELRRFSRDLRPSVLDDLGISAAIRSEAESLEQRGGISVQVNVDGRGGRLEQEVELALLRVTQEAVRNVEQHSHASNVVIGLDFGPTRVVLIIHDDGVGMDPKPTVSSLLSGNHLGIVGMQERARLVGGSLDVTAPDDGGLTIEVVIPVGESPR